MASETRERERRERPSEEQDETQAESPYRGDRQADQARINSLEGELAAANARIAELEGKRSQALVLAGSKDLAPTGKPTTAAAKWFGAPLKLELTRTWNKEFSVDKFEELIDLIRELTGDNGRVEMLKTSMSWTSSSRDKGTGPFINVRVTVRNGTTKLEVTDRLGQLAGVWFGAGMGGGGGGTISLPILAGIATNPWLIPLFIPVWVGSFYLVMRKMFKNGARKRAEKLQEMFEAVEAAIAKSLEAK